MRVCHMRRGWVMSNGVARCMSRRLSQMTASPGSHWWWYVRAPWQALGEAVEEPLRLVGVHADDAVGVAADQQVGPAGVGMDLHQRPQRHGPSW